MLLVFLVSLALLDDLPELVRSIYVLVLEFNITERRSKAFKHDNYIDAEARPKLVQYLDDLVLDDYVQIAVTVLQTLNCIALRHLAQKQICVQRYVKAIQVIQIIDMESIFAPSVVLEIFFKSRVHQSLSMRASATIHLSLSIFQ